MVLIGFGVLNGCRKQGRKVLGGFEPDATAGSTLEPKLNRIRLQ
jgi:hypothetical protein